LWAFSRVWHSKFFYLLLAGPSRKSQKSRIENHSIFCLRSLRWSLG
jgi:hypothetical protein